MEGGEMISSANPDLESLKILVGLAGIVISILLAVVAYFLKQQGEASKALTEAVNQLKTAVVVLQEQSKEKHPIFDRRLNEHSRKIEDHEKRITIIETKHQ